MKKENIFKQKNNVFSKLMISITSIIFYLIMMTVTIYAYFSNYAFSTAAPVKTAIFKTEIMAENQESNDSSVIINSITNDNRIHHLYLTDTGKYKITINPAIDNTSDTGYLLFTINGIDYYTQQLGDDITQENGKTESISFYISITEPLYIYIMSCWGTSSYHGTIDDNNNLYITQNELIEIISNTSSEATTSPIIASEEMDVLIENPVSTQTPETNIIINPTQTPIPEITPVPIESPVSSEEIGILTTPVPTENPLSNININEEISSKNKNIISDSGEMDTEQII